MRNYPVQIISDGVDTGTVTSGAFFVGQSASASFTLVAADDMVAGGLKIQGSNEIPVGDQLKYTPSDASFSDIPNATSTIAEGIGPAIVLQSMCFQYIRAVYESDGDGGSGFTVNMSALGV